MRRAVSMAIDRQKQVDTLYEGHAILGWGIPYFYFQDDLPTAADLGPYWQYRPEEAKKLLAEAGYPNGFKTTLLYYEYFPQMLTITKNDYTTYFGRPYDAGFALWQPHLRNVGQLDLRGNFGYVSSTLARLWIDK